MKKIWIFHQYATPPDKSGLVRAYDFALQLQKKGYEPTVFASGFLHYTKENLLTKGESYLEDSSSGVRFVYLKTTPYGNGIIRRVLSIFSVFFQYLFKAVFFASRYGRPDVIIASTPAPFTCIAGLFDAWRLHVPCICEVRDLWPESIVVYKNMDPKGLVARILYAGERWIYKKARALIFTMEGGRDYIMDKRWDRAHGGPIDIDKVHHINNGVNLEKYANNLREHVYSDDDLASPGPFNVVYTGSIRRVNNIGCLLDAAKCLHDPKIRILIWGDGNERPLLEERVRREGITNVVFKGRVPRHFIPSIVSRASLNILHEEHSPIARYGMSQNKLFEYLAAGRPILQTHRVAYSVLERYGAGYHCEMAPQAIAAEIERIAALPVEETNAVAENARAAAKDYDFPVLTERLIQVIEGVL